MDKNQIIAKQNYESAKAIHEISTQNEMRYRHRLDMIEAEMDTIDTLAAKASEDMAEGSTEFVTNLKAQMEELQSGYLDLKETNKDTARNLEMARLGYLQAFGEEP